MKQWLPDRGLPGGDVCFGFVIKLNLAILLFPKDQNTLHDLFTHSGHLSNVDQRKRKYCQSHHVRKKLYLLL